MIDQNRKKYYNEQSSAYLTHVTKTSFAEDENSMKSEEGVRIGTLSSVYVPDDDNNIVEATYYFDDYKLVIDKEGCELLNKCVQQIYKSFREITDLPTIQKTVFDWVFMSKEEKIDTPLCDYIEAKVQENMALFKCYFKIPFVSMPKDKCLKIAGVKIAYLSPETKSLLANSIESLHSSEYDDFVFASVEVEGNKNSVQNVALERAKFAIDILKINTTLRFAYHPLLASIGIEQSYQNSFRPLTITVNSESYNAFIQQEIFGHKYPIDSKFLDMLRHSEYRFMTSFYEEYLKHKPTSLEKVIKRSISKFSQAISTSDTMEHIVSLCSIMDSIILPDNSAGIKESLKQYIPYLITKPGNSREHIKDNINKVYEIRSKYIHHGGYSNVSNQELAEYNYIVYSLIVRLIDLRTKFHSVKELQDYIDGTIANINFF